VRNQNKTAVALSGGSTAIINAEVCEWVLVKK